MTLTTSLAIKLFSPFSQFGYLPTITSANGTQTQAQGFGTTYPFPSLLVDLVLDVPGLPLLVV